MARKAPSTDPGDENLRVGHAKDWAAGVPAVAVAMRDAVNQMGVKRSARDAAAAEPEEAASTARAARGPRTDKRHIAEFCENGAKAVAEEATLRRISAGVLRRALRRRAGERERLLARAAGPADPRRCCLDARAPTHYRPIELGRRVRRDRRRAASALAPPTRPSSTPRAAPATRRRSSISCSSAPSAPTTCRTARTCATSRRGSALTETIGVGKGSVSLDDLDKADLIIVVGPEPGHQPPADARRRWRRRSARGARIIAVNPLPEAGLLRFKNPQTPAGRGRHGHAAGRPVPADQGRRRPGAVPGARTSCCWRPRTRRRAPCSTTRSSTSTRTASTSSPRPRAAPTGPTIAGRDRADPRARSRRRCELVRGPQADHRVLGDGADPAQALGADDPRGGELPAARAATSAGPAPGSARCAGTATCRATARWASARSPRPRSSTRWRREFGFDPPRAARLRHGRGDPGDARRRAPRCSSRWAATSSPRRRTPRSTEAALRRCALTVHVSTKLNRSHAVTGRRALILPTLGRTERDVQAAGEQFVTVEDSMGMVHASRGGWHPASRRCCREVGDRRPAGRARCSAPSTRCRGRSSAATTTGSATAIARVVPGFDDFNARVRAARRLRAAARAARLAHLPDRHRQGRTSP